jgi:hypothetical protein
MAIRSMLLRLAISSADILVIGGISSSISSPGCSTLQGMARARSGQAAAWPLVSDRRGCRGSAVKGGRRPFPKETRSALDGGGAPPDSERASPDLEPGQLSLHLSGQAAAPAGAYRASAERRRS